MLEKLTYRNHFNEIIDFGAGIYVNSNELHDYEWTITKKGNKISNLTAGIAKKKLPVIIMCKSEEEGIAARNRLMEIAEKDCLALQAGRIECNGYYFSCYITKSSKSKYLYNKRYMEVDLTIQSDHPVWVRETTTNFVTGGTGSDTGLDYPHDYPFDYHGTVVRSTINNPSFMSSNFRLVIYGEAVSPTITIAGHVYQVDTTIEEGEYLIIDSTAKTIKLTDVNGNEINKFDDRLRSSYIFEKIPSGTSNVGWDGNYGFDLILLEERSEPKWI